MAFRFENLDIWKRSVDLASRLFDIADELEAKKLFRFAEQLRGAGLSVPNNIAEGSGSTSDKEFRHFLNIARRSVFENANMLIIFQRRGLVSADQRAQLVQELDELCRMITSFSRSLGQGTKARSILWFLAGLGLGLGSLLCAFCPLH